MSCDCNNGSGIWPGGETYCSVCQLDKPYPIVSSESVPSLISNLTYALYGQITKSVVNGQIVWNIPCDPNLTAQINGLPRNAGEGLLCYFIRCFNLILSGSFVIQPGSITPAQLSTGAPTWNTSGDLTTGRDLTVTRNLIVTGTITGSVSNATNATNSTNLIGGSAGCIPYQNAANATSFTSAGSAGNVLTSNAGTSAPSWKPTAANGSGNANSLALYDGSGNLTAPTFNGNATTATKLSGGISVTLTGAITGTANDSTTPGVISVPTSLAAGASGVAQAFVIFDATLPAITGGALSVSSANTAQFTGTLNSEIATGDFVTVWPTGGSAGFRVTGVPITVNGAGFTYPTPSNITTAPTSWVIQIYHVIRNSGDGLVTGFTSIGQATKSANGQYILGCPAFANTAHLPIILVNTAGLSTPGSSAANTIKLSTVPNGSGTVALNIFDITNTTAEDFPYTQIIVF